MSSNPAWHHVAKSAATQRGGEVAPAAAAQGTPVIEPTAPREIQYSARASFETLLEVSSDVVVLHRLGTVIYANPAAARTIGLLPGNLAATPLLELFHCDDRASVAARVMSPAPNAAEAVLALRWRAKEGGYRSTETIAAPVEFEGVPAVLVVARDLTERAEFQHQLLQQDRMAPLNRLSAGVANEINNPLTYLLVNLEHVLRRLRAASASDDPVAELDDSDGGSGGLASLVQALQQAVQGANRVRQIVRNLLTFSQGNVDSKGLADVRGILESAIQMAWHEIRLHARLVKSFAEVPPIDANEAHLGQAFLNLLVNAAQAVPEGRPDENEIRIVTRTDERGNAIVEVSDTGTGIAPEDIPHIFDPFFTTKGDSGTGLGLAISHGTIKGMGGDIQVTSARGEGTTFRVILPPAKTWRGPTVPARTHDVRAENRSRVLVIDDEPMVAEALARTLSDDNDVEIVTDGKQALARIVAGEQYEIILCDLMMPTMTGMDLHAEVVRRAPELASRIVFMTGGASTPSARAFVETIVNPCLEKPLDMSKLRSLIARAVR